MLYEVARMYYEENMTQERVAEQIGLSRPKVQRLLDEARKEGIIQIHLVNPMTPHKDLEEKLENYFKLSKAIIVSGGIKAEEIIRKNIGRAAAKYLEESIRDKDTICASWQIP
jgi:deoxyribonucleoside regulator